MYFDYFDFSKGQVRLTLDWQDVDTLAVACNEGANRVQASIKAAGGKKGGAIGDEDMVRELRQWCCFFMACFSALKGRAGPLTAGDVQEFLQRLADEREVGNGSEF